jgi:uncharacterized peroxidase-related enzyme
MVKLVALNPTQATGKVKDLLAQVQAQLGMVPNMMRTMANSPAMLEGYLSFSNALAGGVLSPQLREQIALTVAEINSCEYCLSAHTTIGKMVGLSDRNLNSGRLSFSDDPKIDVTLKFARAVVVNQGQLTTDYLNRLHQVGYVDAEIVEIIANVILNIFTNYFNHIAETEVDFPKVVPGNAKVA